MLVSCLGRAALTTISSGRDASPMIILRRQLAGADEEVASLLEVVQSKGGAGPGTV